MKSVQLVQVSADGVSEGKKDPRNREWRGRSGAPRALALAWGQYVGAELSTGNQ